MLPDNLLPLWGKRILITAPRIYASRLSDSLLKQGALPIFMPTIETCFLNNYTELDAALQQLERFDWVAFTSRNGIAAFFNRVHRLNLSQSYLKSCRFCAIGKDAEYLSNFGTEVNLLPSEPSPTGIVAALSQIPNINQHHILVPIPEVIGLTEPNIIPNFISDLKQLGLTVTPVPAYQTRRVNSEIYDLEIDLIHQAKIDGVAFSSTAEVEGFLQILKTQPPQKQTIIACFGPYTAANAKQLGLPVQIVAKNYSSFDGFAEAITEFFQTASRSANAPPES